MAKAISQFFSDLGLPFNNKRWSWGAQRDDVVVLRTWQHDYRVKEKKITVLQALDSYRDSDSYGLDERIRHVQKLWTGPSAGYLVIATAKDPDATPREIKYYRDDVLFTISHLEVEENGSISANISGMVGVTNFESTSSEHQTIPVEGAFPVSAAERSGYSTDNLAAKLPNMRSWLIERCAARETVFYSDFSSRYGLFYFTLHSALSSLGRQSLANGEPIITAVIIDPKTLSCSVGFRNEFGIEDDAQERERCYLHWAKLSKRTERTQGGVVIDATSPSEEFESRVRRFANVEIRPSQAAFRQAVFRACDGKCIVSGCTVPEALEAAHIAGRDWREGHNAASDGILLRRDLHTLYDRGLLTLEEDGTVTIHDDAQSHYKQFHSAST